MKKTILLFALALGAISLNSCSEEQLQIETSQELKKSEEKFQLKNKQELKKSTESDWPKIKEGGVKTTWTIGRKSRGCDGLGICKHKKTSVYIKFEQGTINVPSTESTQSEYNEIDGFISPAPHRSQFSFLINHTNLDRVQDYFGASALILEEDFHFENEEAEELRIDENFVIKAGTYNFIYDEVYDVYEIVFTNENN